MHKKDLGSYRIELCESEDDSDLMEFIDEYWDSGHILSYHQELLDWLYYDDIRGHYNFAIARMNDNDEIIGILGFIPTYHFDRSLEDRQVNWLTIWQVRDDVEPSGFGLQLLNLVSEYQSPVATGAIGINNQVSQIYQRLKYKVGCLNHYYMLNKSTTDFSLIDGFDGSYMSSSEYEAETTIENVTNKFSKFRRQLDEAIFESQTPEFSTEYINNRYIEHPFFDYQVYHIQKGEDNGILAVRPVSHEGSVALRWVEYLGKPRALTGAGPELQRILQNNNAEYIDIYNSGIKRQIFKSAGLKYRDRDADIVIPDYYAPFERRNVEIKYAYKMADEDDMVMYNGHSDMDRPNDLDNGGTT